MGCEDRGEREICLLTCSLLLIQSLPQFCLSSVIFRKCHNLLLFYHEVSRTGKKGNKDICPLFKKKSGFYILVIYFKNLFGCTWP